jgi:hypothetical protein
MENVNAIMDSLEKTAAKDKLFMENATQKITVNVKKVGLEFYVIKKLALMIAVEKDFAMRMESAYANQDLLGKNAVYFNAKMNVLLMDYVKKENVFAKKAGVENTVKKEL